MVNNKSIKVIFFDIGGVLLRIHPEKMIKKISTITDISFDIVENSFPEELKITAKTENGLIMALEHREYSIYGVQFHPESIVTEHGMKMVENFLNI